MAYQIENAGFEVDGIKFDLWIPTITEEALKLMEEEDKKEEGNKN